MATITTNTTLDAASRTAAEAYTIQNGAVFTIDTHVRYHNGVSGLAGAAGLGSFTMTGASGGEVFVDATKVKMVAYNTGSGNVPAYNTSITQGGVTGVFLCAMSALNAAPTAVGAAMPSSGYIMFKSVSGGSFAAGALTGIGATVVGSQQAGFLEIVGCDAAGVTGGRAQKWKHRDQWFYPFNTSGNLITTSGSRGQQIQLPNFGGANRFYPGIWIETGVGTNQYEFWPAMLSGTGSGWSTSHLGTDARSKFVQCLAGGIIRIGSDGTNNIGDLPVSGCKVRIPNILLANCAASPTASDTVPNATLATRFDFTTTNAMQLDIEGWFGSWYLNTGQAYSVKLYRFAHFDGLTITECATALDLNDGGTGLYGGINTDAANFTLTSNFAGGTITDWKTGRSGTIGSADYGTNVQYCNDITFTRCHFQNRTFRTNAGGHPFYAAYCDGLTFIDCVNVGCSVYLLACTNTTLNNQKYADSYHTTSSATTPPVGAIQLVNGTLNTIIDGFSWYTSVANVHPDTAILYLSAAYGVKCRNIGTFASKLSAGSSNAMLYFCNDAGNSQNLKFQRIYFDLIATTFYNAVNSSKNVLIENCSTNVTVYKNLVSAALNQIVKNCNMAAIVPASTASIYGSEFYHHFTSSTAGRLGVKFSEPTAEYAPYITTSFTTSSTGTSGFNSSQGMALVNSGDYAIFEFPFRIKGIDSFQNSAPTVTTATNMTVEYQIDTGSGWNGTWKTFNASNLSGETVDEVAGFKFKLRFTASATSASNILTECYALTNSNATAQAIQYDLDTVTVTLDSNVSLSGAEVRIYDLDNNPAGSLGTEITGTESNGTSGYSFSTTGSNNIWIQIMKSGYKEYGLSYTTGSADVTLPIQLAADLDT